MATPLTPRPGHDTPGGDPMTYYEPHARWGHWTALIDGKLYTYGGYYPWVPREPPSVVELFDITTELWEQSTTSGPPPPGFIDAACVVMGENCYHFAGQNGVDDFNTIHELDSHTLTWKELKPTNPRAAPMCKAGACMVSFGERNLVTFAGYGTLPKRTGTRRRAEYVSDPKSKGYGGRCGWTNELLVFDTTSMMWSSPEITGSPPPPCEGATFTRVDHDRAVVYGGAQLRELLPNHIHILDMRSWMWMRTTAGDGPGQPWPVARYYHSAVSLHHLDGAISDPGLMVWWGYVGDGKTGRDAWVFRVNTLQWEEISLPDALIGRIAHTTTIVHCNSTLWKVINIGGAYEWPLGAMWDTLVPVLETVIVELRSSGPSGDLVVTDVKFKGRRTPSLGQPWRASGFPLEVGTEQRESIPEEKEPVPTEEPVVKLEPKQEKEESVVAEKKDVARELVQKLLEHKQRLEEKEEEIAKKDEQLVEREEELAKMEKQLAEKDDQLAEKDVHLAEKLAEKDVQLAEKLAEKDVQLAEKLAEKDAQLAKKLAEKVEELGELEKQLAEMGNQLTKKKDEMASLAEHSSDLIQMKSQELEALKAVTTSDYLRGMEVIAGTTFHLTGRRQTHVWEGHGLRLHIPETALPPDHTGCSVDVRAGLSGQFKFSDGSHPVSAMYWLSCKETFLVPATLELQHCAIVRDATQCSRLRFASAKCSQPELPYTFKSLDRGVFTPNSSYGSITLSQFSIVAITGESSEESYYAKLFYMTRRLNQWQLDFTVTRNLELCIKHVDETYNARSAEPGPDLEVEFEEDKISLDIPDCVTIVRDGWEITPLTPPQITKKQVDSFKTGQRIPTCRLQVEWVKRESPGNLKYKVNLHGTKEPHNYFHLTISNTPAVGAAVGEKRRLQQHDDTEQEIGHVKRRKSDIGEKESSASESSRASSSTRTSSSDNLLTDVNKFEIVKYLKRISRNQDLVRLGEGLGLDGTELRRKLNSEISLDDLVRDWLERKYRVDEVGRPTWRKLVEVLREVGQNGLANDIEDEELKKSN